MMLLYELYERDRKGKPYLLAVSSVHSDLARIAERGDWIESHEYHRRDA